MLFSLQYLYSPIWYSVSWLQTSLHVLLLLLSHFSCVRLCVTLETAATRLPHPWDSPGKNTGVGCHFLLQCMKVKSESEVAQSIRPSATPWTAAHQAPPSMGFSRQDYWSGVPSPSPNEPARAKEKSATAPFVGKGSSKNKLSLKYDGHP